MLAIPQSAQVGGSTDLYCKQNFAYTHGTRALVCGSGGGGGTFGTSTSTSPAPVGTPPSGFPALTLASIGIFTGTGAITVQGNFTGNTAVRGNYGPGAPDTTSAIANFPARSAVIVLTGAGLSEGTPGSDATATTTGLRGGRLAAEYIAEALNMPTQPAFDTQGLVDVDGQPILLRFGASTDNWQVIGLGPRIASGRDEVGLLVIQNLNTTAAGSANTRPPAGQALLLSEYVQTNTTENPFGTWSAVAPGVLTSGQLSMSGSNLTLHPENSDGTSRLAELLSIPAGAVVGFTRVGAGTQLTRTVTGAGPTFSNGEVSIVFTTSLSLTTGQDYEITLTESEITTGGGGGGSVSATLTETAGDRFLSKLNEIARGDHVNIGD